MNANPPSIEGESSTYSASTISTPCVVTTLNFVTYHPNQLISLDHDLTDPHPGQAKLFTEALKRPFIVVSISPDLCISCGFSHSTPITQSKCECTELAAALIPAALRALMS